MSEEESSAFSGITKIPIAPFSAFLNDLNRPFFLNNLHPSTEIIKTGVNFPESIEKPEIIPHELFECSSFNPSKIILNTPPIKEITHEYDEFMLKVLEQCYEVKSVCVKENSPMTIPNPIISTPVKTVKSNLNITETFSTPSALKVKLKVANTSSNTGALLKKLLVDESFVNPLCFDCENDLIQIARVIRSFSLLNSPIQPDDQKVIKSIGPILSKYLEDVLEHLDQSTESIDPVKATYCICLIGLLNIERSCSKESLQDYNSFDLVMKFHSMSETYDSADLILSIVIESYVALLNKFKIHDSEVSSYSSHLFDLCFESTGVLTRTSSVIALSQIFSKYPEYRSYIIDQLLMKSSDSEIAEVQKFSVTIIMTCLQALCSDQSNQASSISLVSSILNSCLKYFWKGDNGNELPKASNVFFVMMEELLNIFSDFHWPIASLALNNCSIQMFHYLLKEEISSNPNSKGSLLLKLRLLDILSNISKVISSDSGPNEKRSLWQSIGQHSLFTMILSPKNTFESLNQITVENFDQEFYTSFLQSGPLSKIPERVTGLFIKLISSEVIQLRSKAIKNLFNLMNSSQLCKSNYDALKANILIKASDPSISVRDAGLEFISKLIFTPPPFETDPKDLIESVLSRIKDRGVSVRKRAVKVIGEILQKGIVNGSEMKFSCVGSLISHISDEDDEVVIEMISKTLKEQWIMCYLGKDFLNLLPLAQRKIMSTFAEEVVKVIGHLESDIKCLQDFLGKFLIDESIKKDYSVFFAGTVEVLLENLLQSLEGNDIKSLKSSLESISLFSESNPQSLENHLGLLQSLLRSEDAEISLLSMKLISGVIPKASLTEMKKLKDFEKDLLSLIYRGSEISVKLSIETLYHYVNNCSHQYGTLSSLWQKFTDYLKARMSEEKIDSSAIPHICRALLATGVLCAQSARHREREFGLKDFHSGAQARCLLEFVGYFSKMPVNFIRSCSNQAFGSLIMSCPQVSISSNQLCRSLISASLSETEDDSCKIKMLLVFDQMIKKFDGGYNPRENLTDTGSNILAMEGDESYFSALIQEYLKLISNCIITSESFEVRATALKICSSSAIFGLVNPQLIIPYLAVGLNSENDHIQAFSRSSYERLLTRFPSMISKDLLTPIKLLYRQSNIRVNCHLSPLSFYYNSIRGKTGKVGIEALNGVFALFEAIITSTEEYDVEFIKFIIQVIATLPFSNSEEVLYCLQRIQGIFSMSSDNLGTESIHSKFILLKGLSYAVNYLIKSYPQVVGMSIEVDEFNLTNKTLQRNSIEFEFPQSEKSTTISIEEIQNFIINQPSIPLLLHQDSLKSHRRSTNQQQKYLLEIDDHEDEDISNFLVDDEEISDSNESSEEEDFADIKFDDHSNKKTYKAKNTKKQTVSNNKNKKAISVTKKQKKK